MSHIVFFMRPLQKLQFRGYRGGFPYVRCYTDIDYEVHTDWGEVLTSGQAWGRHPTSTNLLDYYGGKTDPTWFSFELRSAEDAG